MAAKAKVLCVDDDRAHLECRSYLLKASGYEAVTADSGMEALSIFQAGAFDLVLVDYAMPDMDGGVLAAKLKAIAPHIPVLMISGHDHVPSNATQWVDQFMSKGEGATKFLVRVRDLLAQASPFADLLRSRETTLRAINSVKEP